MALTYLVAGRRLELMTGTGDHSAEEARRVFVSIRNDPAVPAGLGLLVDVRAFHQPVATGEIHQRLSTLITELAPKIAPVSAFVINDTLPQAVTAAFVQDFARERGVHVLISRDLDDARAWLDRMLRSR